MKKFKLLGVIILLTQLCFVGHSQSTKGEEIFTKPDVSFVLNTASVASGVIRAIQYTENDGKPLLFLQTFNDDDIHIYNLNKEQVSYNKKFDIQREGPNGIKRDCIGFYVLQKDTILVFSRNNRIHYFNYEGEKYDEFEFDPFITPQKVNGVPYFFGSAPMTSTNSIIYGSTAGASFEFDLHKVGYSFDPKNKVLKWLLEPGKYVPGYWGQDNPSFFSYVIANGGTDQVFVSLPNSHDIIEINASGDIVRKHTVQMSKIGKLKPLSSKKKKFSTFRQESHFAKQGMYYELLYDPYLSKYYRIAYAPVSEFTKKSDAYKYPYIMVLDDKLRVEKELRVPDKYKYFFQFISPSGICLFNVDEYELNEDNFVFDCFKL